MTENDPIPIIGYILAFTGYVGCMLFLLKPRTSFFLRFHVFIGLIICQNIQSAYFDSLVSDDLVRNLEIVSALIKTLLVSLFLIKIVRSLFTTSPPA